MALHVAVAARNALIDLYTDNFDGGTIEIYDGTQPATTETAITTQVLLAVLTFNATSFAAASGASATANAITADTSANATGTATWARLKNSGGTARTDCTVGTSGTNIVMNTVSIQAGAQVSISSFTVTQAAG